METNRTGVVLQEPQSLAETAAGKQYFAVKHTHSAPPCAFFATTHPSPPCASLATMRIMDFATPFCFSSARCAVVLSELAEPDHVRSHRRELELVLLIVQGSVL